MLPYLKALPGHVQSKSLYASLGERCSLEALQTSVTTERFHSTSHAMLHCLMQQNLHAIYWVVLREERKPPPPRGKTISE